MTRDQRNILEILNPDRNRIKHKVREVPDHEEVFTHPVSDQSIMIEILEFHDVPDEHAAEYYILIKFFFY